MIVAGCDIGSLTAKAVIMEKETVIASAVIRAAKTPADSADTVMKKVLDGAGLEKNRIAYLVGTGYGRTQIPFVDSVESEISCHARGARHLWPSVRMSLST